MNESPLIVYCYDDSALSNSHRPISIHPQSVANLQLVVGREVVDFVEVFQTNAVDLRDKIHALSRSYHMDMVTELLVGMLALLLQIDDIAIVESVVVRSLIVFRQVMSRDAHFTTNRGEGVACTRLDIIILVAFVDGILMLRGSGRFLRPGMRRHITVVVGGTVVTVELVQFDDID